MQPVAQDRPARTTPVVTPLHAMLDIGSNAMKLAICSYPEADSFRTVHLDERITRLNRGIDEEGNIDEATIERVLDAAAYLIQEAKEHGAVVQGAVGTAALRKANNAVELINRLKEDHGVSTRILTPKEEAAAGFFAVREFQLTQKGRVNGHGFKPLVTFDLGGRSVEMTVGSGAIPESYISLELGASHLWKAAPTSDPPVPAELEHIKNVVREQLKHVERPPRDAEVTLIGATATTLTGYVPMLLAKEHGPDAINYLDRDIVRALVEKLSQMTVSQRRQLPGNPLRADIILHGAIAIEQAFKYLGFRHADVSPDGVAAGTMISELKGKPLDFEPVHVRLPGVNFRPFTRSDRSGEVVFALRRSDGRICLQRKIDYPSGIYRIPGGGVDRGEDIQAAYHRELYEETGLEGIRSIPLATLTYSGPDEYMLPFESRLYLAEIGDADPMPIDTDEGIEDYAPVALENLPLWVDRLEMLSGSMQAWGIFRAAAVRTLIDKLQNMPV